MLKVSALEGPFGGHVITGSADNSAISKCDQSITVTVWNVTGAKAVRVQKISTERPSDEELFKYEDHERERINYSSEHVLNTPSALRRLNEVPKDLNKPQLNKAICAYCFP